MITKEDKLGMSQRMIGLPALMHLTENAVRFFLATVLAGAEILDGCSMGGVAVVAVSGPGTAGLAALLGACFGYLCFQGLVEGLRYVAACVLVYALSFAFCDVSLCHRSWFMPTAAALLNGVVSFIYLSEDGWRIQQVILFLTEITLTAALAYFYRLAFDALEDTRAEGGLTVRQIVGILALCCTILITLNQVTLLDELSLGRILAALITMMAGWQGGVGTGSALGIAAGLAMDFADLSVPYYSMTFGFAGLISGVFWKQGRLMTAVAYAVASGAAVLWTWQSGPRIGLIYEVFVASLIFLLMPERLLRRLSALVRQDGISDNADRARQYAVRHLTATAAAFRELATGLSEVVRASSMNKGKAASIFDRAADRVCVRCALREVCWNRDYQSTRAALNDALPVLLDKGRGTANDYPAWFATKCVEFRAFSAAVNEELAAWLTRRQYQARARENRATVCRQYEQLAGALEKAATELSQELAVDTPRQRRIQQRLAALGLEGESAVYYDEYGHLRVEIAGTKLTVLESQEEQEKLAQLMGVPLRRDEGKEKGSVCLVQSEPLMAVVGVAAREKDGQNVSGDAGAWFKDEAGRLHIFLCDGMGSGQSAREDSTCAVELLERFLRAGVEPIEALRTLNDSLALRGEERGGFTTIDLLRFDLFTGEGTIYKLGAAATYVRRGEKTLRLTGQSFPAGLSAQGSTADVIHLKLSAGDWLIMASDGVTGGEDSWIIDALQNWEGGSPRQLAQDLLEGAAQRQLVKDDRTVVVLKVCPRS